VHLNKWCWSSPLIDHRVCSKDGGIVICNIDVLRGNHVQKVDRSLERLYFLVGQVCFHGDEFMKKDNYVKSHGYEIKI